MTRSSAALLGPTVCLALSGASVAGALPSRIDEAALRRLETEARRHGADVLLVSVDGRPVLSWHSASGRGRAKAELMSTTKSFTSLAIGMLVDEGRLRSLDEPVHQWLPWSAVSWRVWPKSAITLRHLLSHTTGLSRTRSLPIGVLSQDHIRYSLSVGMVALPGRRFEYNNWTCDLLSAVVGSVAGEPLDKFLKHRLFNPLGINDWSWDRDRLGEPYGYTGLSLTGEGLLRVGEMLCRDGTWGSARIVSKAWIHRSMQLPASSLNRHCGLLWWLLYQNRGSVLSQRVFDRLCSSGASRELRSAVRPLVGIIRPRDVLLRQLRAKLGDRNWTEYARLTKDDDLGLRRVLSRAPIGFNTSGEGDEGFSSNLLVLPAYGLAVVRLGRCKFSDSWPDWEFNAQVLSTVRLRSWPSEKYEPIANGPRTKVVSP